MKITNNDLQQLHEIKQYFLDPPHSFRLYQLALPKAEAAMQIVARYPRLAPLLTSLEIALEEMKNNEKQPAQLRNAMIAFGRSFNYLNRS